MSRGVAARLAACLIAAFPGTAGACALQLVLAMDVSGSINAREHALQTGGLAAAFESEALANAVAALEGGMLVTFTQWSGGSRQRQMTSWRKVTKPEHLRAFAAEIRAAPREWRNFSTAIGEALLHAELVSRGAPLPCLRRVIDVSGDGVSNEGRPPRAIADGLEAQGFTVNGLVIRGADPDPVEHYLSEVIAGPGAFVEVAEDFEDYPRAILRKLLREIDQPMMVSEAPPQ
ncbi:DUF1194 domain-containing protein [Paralimibaculum aggregatum]|uniref:DUF1194 domain-containing protein n=1 Tax=Paralimibaculum aggregatum TaxID=3036245 RepID=A0ABQ6LLU4_9RHOB|nr:DUF1194 domain-containing protein [Limibaculum sp. NKW23]GMG83411.1 DUF1194 domain-containing protein [Limibaculum sp. NKW23]